MTRKHRIEREVSYEEFIDGLRGEPPLYDKLAPAREYLFGATGRIVLPEAREERP
jgi:hypothetical protein